MPFYHNDKGRKVFIINTRPRNLSNGGYIKDHKAIPKKDAYEDTIMADLEDGSLVIPRPVAWMMKYYPGKITGPKEMDKKKLLPTVVMAHEYVVDKQEASKVEHWLKKHGVELPVPKGWDLTKRMKPKKQCMVEMCSLCRMCNLKS